MKRGKEIGKRVKEEKRVREDGWGGEERQREE